MKFQIYLLLKHRVARLKQAERNNALFDFLSEVHNENAHTNDFILIT